MELVLFILMATFTADEAIAVLKRPKDQALDRAVWHEKRLELHTEPTIKAPHNPAFEFFLSQVESRVPDNKFRLFKSLIEYPIETVAFTKSMFTQIAKVFYADDAFKKITFKNQDFTEEFQKEIKKSDEFFRDEGFDAMKSGINSILVVDLPSEQEGTQPDPYSFLLDIKYVTQIGINRDNFCEYLAYDTGHKVNKLGTDKGDYKLISFIDDSAYRLYVDNGESFLLVSESPHDLGYTPAKPFWNDFFNRKEDRINKNAPISEQLGMLDQLLFKEVSKEHSDLFTLYPIIWSYPEEKNYEDPSVIDYNGEPKAGIDGTSSENSAVPYSDWQQGVFSQRDSYNKDKMGPGRDLETPIPTNEQPALGIPGGYIEPKTENLKFIGEDLKARREEIYIATLGFSEDAKNDQAKNEKQILSGVESRTTVLLNIKKNFEVIQKFDLITKAKLIYGPDMIIDCAVNYGSNFFLQSPAQMEEAIEISEKAGMPWFAIEQQKKDAIMNRYRNNPDMLRRQEILKSVSAEIVLNLAQQGIMPDMQNFEKITSSLISRFETQNNIKIEAIDPELPISGVTTIIVTELLSSINQGNIYGNTGTSPQEAGTEEEGREA